MCVSVGKLRAWHMVLCSDLLRVWMLVVVEELLADDLCVT